MEFVVLSIDAKQASIEIREKVSFQDSQKLAFTAKLQSLQVQQSVLVSTCNRSEVYAYVAENEIAIKIQEAFDAFFQFDTSAYRTMYYGEQALYHLFEVVAGFQSEILGEDQIMAQMKAAFVFAQHSGSDGKQIHRIFQDALHCARHLKDTLKISYHPTSLAYLLMKDIEQREIGEKRILLCGSGQLMQTILPYVMRDDVLQISMIARNITIRRQLQKQYPRLQFIPFEQRYEALSTHSILISATSSPHLLFMKQDIVPSIIDHVLYDLALPRDIDELLQEEAQYQCVSIDDIKQEQKEQQAIRKQLCDEGASYVYEAVAQTSAWLKDSKLDPAIATFQQHCFQVADDTYALLQDKLSLSNHEERLLEKTLQYSFSRFIKEWISVLHEQDEASVQAILHSLQKEEDCL